MQTKEVKNVNRLFVKNKSSYLPIMASHVAQRVKDLPAMQETQETWVRSLGQEDPLE